MEEATRIVYKTEQGTLRYNLQVEMEDGRRGDSVVFLEEYALPRHWQLLFSLLKCGSE